MICPAQGPLQWKKVSVAQKWWFQYQLKQCSEWKKQKQKKKDMHKIAQSTNTGVTNNT